MATVFDVAEYILGKLGSVTTMKLHKLIYYCQAWSLAWDDEPIFKEDFEAWANGPVCPELFNKHKGRFSIEKRFFKTFTKEVTFSPENIETMDAVIRDYGNKSPQWLSDLTHSEDPWINARKGIAPGASCNNIIEKESMRQYYGGL